MTSVLQYQTTKAAQDPMHNTSRNISLNTRTPGFPLEQKSQCGFNDEADRLCVVTAHNTTGTQT